MTIIGAPRQFHRKFKFQIELDAFDGAASFASCSELKAEIAKIEYYEGGSIIPYKEPGRMTFPDITIERAVTDDERLYDWFVQTANAAQNSGLVTPYYKQSGTIVQLDRNNERLREWTLYGVWPISYTAGSWDNNSDEFTIEQIVLGYDYFVMGSNLKRVGAAIAQGVNAVKKALG